MTNQQAAEQSPLQEKHAHIGLHGEELDYRFLVENTKDVIWTADMSLRLTYISPSVQEFLGFTPEEYRKISLSESITPGSYAIIQALLIQTIQELHTDPSVSMRPYTIEVEFYSKSGDTVWAEVRASFLCNETGEPIGVVGITRDINDRKKAEQALKMSEQRYRLLTETTSDWVWETDADNRYTYANEKAKDLLGYEVEYLIGKTPFDIMPPDEADRVKNIFGEIAAGREPFLGLENIILHKNGSQVIVETSGVPLFDAQGKYLGYQGCDRDITERKQAEQELLAKTAILEAQTNSSLDGILIVDRNEKRVMINQRLIDQWNVPQETLDDPEDAALLRHALKLAKHPWRFLRCVIQLRSYPNATSRDEVELNDGTIFDRYSSPVIGADGKYHGRVWTYRDITARKRSEMAIRHAKEAAEEATKAKSAFLANMSHEIRTPMTAILGFTDILLERLHDKEDLEAAQTIKRNSIYLLDIINDILDLSKIEADKLILDRSLCSPLSIVNEVLSLMHPRAEEKGILTEICPEGAIPELIVSDPVRLRQVLINLIGNAVKFTEQGIIHVTLQHLKPENKPELVQFTVSDTGIGMKPEQMQMLFRPFMQGDASTSRKYGGTGLGLVISKRLAHLLGGDISVASDFGHGSTFCFTVAIGDTAALLKSAPLIPRETYTEPPAHSLGIQDHVLPSSCRILLAEDGPDNQRLLTFMLTKAGAEVVVAGNGQAAVELALASQSEGKSFDLMLMDMQMPILDGYDATRMIRQRGITTPIIAITAHAMASDRDKCMEAGCDDYLSKPIERHVLLDMVRRYVQLKTTDHTPVAS